MLENMMHTNVCDSKTQLGFIKPTTDDSTDDMSIDTEFNFEFQQSCVRYAFVQTLEFNV